MPTSSSKKKKSSAKSASKKSSSRSSSARTTEKAARKTSKSASKAKAKKTARTAKAPAVTKRKTPAKVRKPIRFDYLLEKLQESHGKFSEIPQTPDTLDVLILSLLGQHLSFAETMKAFQSLKTQFVDWNEVRISSAGEVREVLKGASEPLELAISLKDFLQHLFIEQHHVGLEFLREKSNPEIRSFFKKHSVFSEATVTLMLERINEYPVVPLENYVQTFLERVGLDGKITPLQRQKDLYEKIPREHVLALHLMLHDQGRLICPPVEEALACPECTLKRGCPYPAKVTPRQRTAYLKSAK